MGRFLIGVAVGFLIADFLAKQGLQVGYLEKVEKVKTGNQITTVSEGYLRVNSNETIDFVLDPMQGATLMTLSEAQKVKKLIASESPDFDVSESFSFVPYDVVRRIQLTTV